MITFLNPLAFILLAVIPPLFGLWRHTENIRFQRFRMLGQFAEDPTIRTVRKRALFLVCFSYACTVVALARPTWGSEIEIVNTQGLSAMLLLDVSTSMDSEDVLPSRLERAKLTLRELIPQLNGSEIGLILFAGESGVQFPLTTDVLSPLTSLNAIETSRITKQGTNLIDALQLAVVSLNAASNDRRVVILLSDGEIQDDDITSAIDNLVATGTTVYAIGYGNTIGVPIPVKNPDGSIVNKFDARGNLVLSSLVEDTLKRLSDATGGVYQRAGAGGEEVSILLQSIKQTTTASTENSLRVKKVERFDIFLIFAIILLGLELWQVYWPRAKG